MEQHVMRGAAAYEGGSPSVGAARDFLTTFLARARNRGMKVSEDLVERARLVVSELVTNAVKYAVGTVSLMLELRPGELAMTVADNGPGLPVPKAPDAARIGQHGLEIVQALCHDLQVTEVRGGKRIRVHLSPL
ncbi:ATP-binding protein [Streptomyces sp. NPDC060194]|uniref:ATP-binding protein n=1 Tax=Streptomyces sp. NPDC060194 TaxID=3347069 RepID=UPI0036591097